MTQFLSEHLQLKDTEKPESSRSMQTMSFFIRGLPLIRGERQGET